MSCPHHSHPLLPFPRCRCHNCRTRGSSNSRQLTYLISPPLLEVMSIPPDRDGTQLVHAPEHHSACPAPLHSPPLGELPASTHHPLFVPVSLGPLCLPFSTSVPLPGRGRPTQTHFLGASALRGDLGEQLKTTTSGRWAQSLAMHRRCSHRVDGRDSPELLFHHLRKSKF